MGYPTDADGHQVFSPGFVETQGFDGVYLGFRWEVVQGTTSIHDYALENNMKLQGGYRMISSVGGSPADGDYMEMEVVDKNNATGQYDGTNPYGMNPGLVDRGLVVGVDVLSLFKYVRDEQCDPADVGRRYEYLFASATFVPALFQMRSKYVSVGSGENIIVKCAYKGYEA